MRRTVMVALAVGMFVLVAPAASAKGLRVSRVEIAGPGLDEPLSLTKTRMPDGVAPLPSEFLDIIWGGRGWTSKTPEEQLGPAYMVTVRLSRTDISPNLYRLTVFPFAQDGPWTYTDPLSRDLGDGTWVELAGGWARLPVRFEQWFVDQGVPLPSATTVIERGPILGIVTIAVCVAMLVALGVRRTRRRAALTPA